MSTYVKYNGEIRTRAGWQETFSLQKDDGTFTRQGSYSDVFRIGDDRYVLSPYWHDSDEWLIMSATEALALIGTA